MSGTVDMYHPRRRGRMMDHHGVFGVSVLEYFGI